MTAFDGDVSLVADSGRLVAASDAFLDFIGYSRSDVLHLPVDTFFRSTLRATATDADFLTLPQPVTCFIFTATLQARQVTLSAEHLHHTLIHYRVREVPNSRLEERFFLVNQFVDSEGAAFVHFTWPDLVMLRSNRQYLSYAGQEADGLPNALGKPLTATVAGHVREVSRQFTRPQEASMSAQTVWLYEVPDLCGQQRCWDEIWTPVWEGGRIRFVLGMLQDVSERVRIRKVTRGQDELIHRQREQLQAIIDNMSDGIFLVDRDRNVTLLNQGARALFYDPDTFRHIGDTFPHTRYFDLSGNPLMPEDMVAIRVLRGETIQHRGIRCERPDRIMYLSESGSPIFDENGQVEAAVVCSRDVTAQMERNKRDLEHQRRLLELEQRQRESLQRMLEMKDQFFSLVTHEFKTPLAVIDLAVQAIERIEVPQQPSRVHAYLQSIRQSNYRQLRLVMNLLDMARISSGHIRIDRQNCDVVALTRSIVDSVRIFTEKKNIDLRFVSVEEPLILSLDPEKLERMLLNLLSNAIKFSPERSEIAVMLCVADGWIELAVQDQGIGIPPDKQELIFERFGQVDSSLSRRVEGTGIGLALVRQFAQAFGGDVSVVSQPGQGSAFTLRLPALPPDATAETSCPVDAGEHAQAATIEFADVFN